MKIKNNTINKTNQITDLSHCDTGFYTIDFKNMHQLSMRLTLIKLYPQILNYNSITNKY